MEVWKAVIGYEGLYEVSSIGRVRSLNRLVQGWNGMKMKKGQMLTIRQPGRSGYLVVSLTVNQKSYSHFIHRLVATAFIGLPSSDKAVVMHKNDIKTDNDADNLKWGTQKDNIRDCVLKGRKNVVNKRKVIATDIVTGTTREFDSILDSCKTLGLHASNVSKSLTGKRLSTKNYSFKYV